MARRGGGINCERLLPGLIFERAFMDHLRSFNVLLQREWEVIVDWPEYKSE